MSMQSDLSATVYGELRAIARAKIAQERAGHTLQATALVHEAYLRLIQSGVSVELGPAFYWAAAEAMRRVLIDHARGRSAAKRGGGVARRAWTAEIADVCDLEAQGSEEEVGAFTDAVDRLGEHDRRAGDIVRLRFFAGLTVAQAAEVLGVTPRIVKRDWEYARAWLLRELGPERDQPS